MSRRNVPSFAIVSLLSGLAALLGFFGGPLLSLGTLGIWFSMVVGWGWLAALSYHLSQATEGPNGAAALR